MSSTTQHGRRRAESPRKESLAKKFWASTPKPGSPSKRMAAVAIAGALLAGGGIAHAATTPNDSNANFAGVAAAAIATLSSTQLGDANAANASGAVKAPGSAKVDFAKVSVSSSSANTTNVPDVSGAADTVKPLGANGGAVNDPTGAQNFASSKLASFGWGQDQMSCLIQLWNRESDWTTTAENASSLAYGIAQSLPASKMDSVGTDWRTNYKTQIVWGLGYIKDRYGNPCGAWDHETSIGWY